MSEINCNNCAISDFKESLCDRCDEMKRLGKAEDIEKLLIKAFSEVDSPAKSDCISRQAAIDDVRNYYDPEGTDVTSIEDRIKRLPSAQSCEYWDAESGYCAIHRPSAWLQGWEDGREALRKEMWEDEQDRLD